MKKTRNKFLGVFLAFCMLFTMMQAMTFVVGAATANTVSFDANGGTGTMADEDVESGSYILPECTFTPPTGMQFKQWSVMLPTGAQSPAAAGTVYNLTGSIRLIAQWEVSTTYTVSFEANGGTGTMNSVTVTTNTYILPECGFTAPAGKQFKEWHIIYVNGNPTNEAAGTVQPMSGDIFLSPVWEDITTYTVDFDANGGTGTMNPVTVTTAKYTLPACAFTAPAGKQFKEWKVLPVNGNPMLHNAGYEFPMTGNITLVAQWEDAPAPIITSPKTGDNSNVALWISLMFASAVTLIGTLAYAKKKRV